MDEYDGLTLRTIDQRSAPGVLYAMAEMVGWTLFTQHNGDVMQRSPDVHAFGLYDGDEQNELVATTTLTNCGSYTFIGLVIVKEPFRLRRLASKLVQHAVDLSIQYASKSEDLIPNRCRLLATDSGVHVYRKLGFREIGRGTRMRIERSNVSLYDAGLDEQAQKALGSQVRLVSFNVSDVLVQMKSEDDNLSTRIWRKAMKMDDRAVRGSRSRLTESALENSVFYGLYDDGTAAKVHDRQLLAWCAVSDAGVSQLTLAPLIAFTDKHANVLVSLVEQSLFGVHGNTIGLDVNEKSTLYITIDSTSSQAAALEEKLTSDGYTVAVDMVMMQFDISAHIQSQSNEQDEPRQFAMLSSGMS